MSTGIISIGVTGMQAAQLGLMTTEHNITNANTPGFSRQRTIQASNIPVMTGAGAVGQGTHVSTIERMYSQFLSNQVNTSQTNVSSLDTYYSEVKQIDDMLADTNSGLSPALQDFFKGVQQVAANPSSISARQAMVSSAQSLVSRFQSIQDRISQMYDGVNSQITSTVSEINSYAKQIADLNSRIIVAQSSTAQPANDLLDQRDQLVAELNKLVKVDTSANSDGSYNVFIGTGQQLVVGTQASQLAAIASSSDPTRIVVGMQTSGFTQELPESLVNGGQLGGLMQFRSESLDRAFNEMGRVAASVALTVDAQHGLGQDLLGQSAGSSGFVANFFDMTNMQPRVTKNAYNTGNAVFQASFAAPSIAGAYTLSNSAGTYTLTRQSDGQSWSGPDLATLQSALPSGEGVDVTNASVALGGSTTVYNASATSANFYTKLTVSDYRLSYDGTNYTMTRLSDNKSWSNTSLSNLSTTLSNSEGFSFNLNAGTMNANDTFLFQPTKAAAGNIQVNANVAADPRLIAAGMPFRTGAALSNTGSGTIDNGTTLPGYSSSSLPAAGVSISYSGGNLTFAGVPAGANITVTTPGGTSNVYAGPTVPYTSGATISFSGISFQISGVPATGDSFTVGRNTTATGVADGRNAVRLGKLQTQNTAVGGSASFQGAYSQFVSYVGNKTRETKVNGDAQQALLEQAQNSQQALSGVNLDEEAANLLRYQQAYQAAAKMIQVGSKLFDTVLSIGA